jgi:hypothetical protein
MVATLLFRATRFLLRAPAIHSTTVSTKLRLLSMGKKIDISEAG